jgi:glycosyltransferase involved in cell wall biosynthesis
MARFENSDFVSHFVVSASWNIASPSYNRGPARFGSRMPQGSDRRPLPAASRRTAADEPTEAPVFPVGAAERDTIAVFVENLDFGDHQRALIRLANKLRDFGHPVQVVSSASGPLAATLRDGIGHVRLRPRNALVGRWTALRAHPSAARHLLGPLVVSPRPPYALRLLGPLADYLSAARPAVLIGGSAALNAIAVLAKRLAGVSTGVIVTERSTAHGRASYRELLRQTYPDADGIVAASAHMARSMVEGLRIPPERVRCMFDPAIPDDVQRLARAPSPHRWFDVDQPPVVLSAGDPNCTEDFALLVRAFARLRQQRRVRLVLLSTVAVSGGYDALRELATELRVAPDFEMLEFLPNPFAFFARAGVFVSSKTSERVGNLAAEVLVCGCPVVGVRTEASVEVLDNGRYGRLVPGGDVGALANALAEALQAPRDSTAFAARAAEYGEERTARAYSALCTEIGASAKTLRA